MTETKNHGAFIWPVADLLRSDCKQSGCGKVVSPFTVLRRQAVITAVVTGEPQILGVAA